jgi:hypothetical protein
MEVGDLSDSGTETPWGLAAAILAALPPGWCGHGPATREQRDLDDKPFCPTGSAQRYHAIGECDCIDRETPPCPFCGHREHRDDICEQDLGEHGECQCADTRPRSDSDIVRAAYDRLDAVNIDQEVEIARLNETLNSEIAECVRLRAIEEAARALCQTYGPYYEGDAAEALRAALGSEREKPYPPGPKYREPDRFPTLRAALGEDR